LRVRNPRSRILYLRPLLVRRGTPQGEALAVWALLAADVLAVLIVYSVHEPSELYNVSQGGLEGGLGRALVQLNFPIAIVAVPLVLLALDALPRRAWFVGAPALALCAVVAWPGVVDPDDLDAQAINGVPALGVALAACLTIAAGRAAGWSFASRLRGDGVRIAVGVATILVSLPWIAAEAGVYFPEGVFLTEQLYAEPGKPPSATVHLGHHHGMSGTLLVLSALLLSRPGVAGVRLRRVSAALLSLMLAYGLANIANDFWHEQLVKRGWTSWDIPSALEPRVHLIWLVVLLAAGLLYVLGFARRHEPAFDGDNHRR
jgi:hypothetical protein